MTWSCGGATNSPRPAIETDSYIAVQLIERQKEVSPHSLRRMAEVLEGHFTFTVLDQGDTMYFVRGDNPLTIWWCPDMGVYLYASTKEILERAVKALGIRWWRKEAIEPGQGTILAIDREGQRSVRRFDDSNLIASWQWYSPLWRSINRQEDEYLSMVMDMGEQLGIPRQELGLLSRGGVQRLGYGGPAVRRRSPGLLPGRRPGGAGGVVRERRRLWMRLGVSLAVSKREEAAILGDDSELAEKTLRKLLAEGRFTPDGDSDIPGGVVLAFNKKHGTGYNVRDISLDV